MRRLGLMLMAVLLTGASDPWVDARSARLRSRAVPGHSGCGATEAELEAIESAAVWMRPRSMAGSTGWF